MINPKTTKVALVENGAVIAHGTCASIYPRNSFPAQMTEGQAQADFGLYTIERKAVGAYQTNVPVDPYLQMGSVYDNQVQDMTVDERKAVMRRELQAQFVTHRDKGVTVNGARIQTNHDAQQELEALVGKLTRDGGTQKIRTREGVTITADLAAAMALRDAVAAHISAVWDNDATLGEAITNATTHADLDAIDVTAGWPV